MSQQLYSTSGKVHERCRKVKPLDKLGRDRMYSHYSTIERKQVSGEKKFSPFNTIDRDSRTSYLLRVTKEPNTHTNYEVNYDITKKRDRRSTIDQAAFKRIIGPVNHNDYSIDVNEDRDHRCIAAMKAHEKRPLTVRESHQWRKTHENLDFKKQIDPQRVNNVDFMKTMKSTQDTFLMETLRGTTESNFNNYRRFSMKSGADKSHAFKSDSGHQFHRAIENREIEPEYDILASKQEFFRPSMRSPRGELRFSLFREQIQTRKDRADPHWVQKLDYDANYQSIDSKTNRTIDFEQVTPRQQNLVHSKYPIRQSLKPHIPLNRGH